MPPTTTAELPVTLASRLRGLVAGSHAGSINAAAKSMGIPQPTLLKIVKGAVPNPRASTLLRIASYYGVTSEWLLTGAGLGPKDDEGLGEWLDYTDTLRRLRLSMTFYLLARDLVEVIGLANVFMAHQLAGDDEAKIREIAHKAEANEQMVFAQRSIAAAWDGFMKYWEKEIGGERLAALLEQNVGLVAMGFVASPLELLYRRAIEPGALRDLTRVRLVTQDGVPQYRYSFADQLAHLTGDVSTAVWRHSQELFDEAVSKPAAEKSGRAREPRGKRTKAKKGRK